MGGWTASSISIGDLETILSTLGLLDSLQYLQPWNHCFHLKFSPFWWCKKRTGIVFMDVTGEPLCFTPNCSLFPSACSRNISLDPKDPRLSDFFPVDHKAINMSASWHCPISLWTPRPDSECWLLLAAQLSWTSSRTLYCNIVIFRQADANKYL